jgi:ABC-type branched-subunit amino acid transport system substrate-binding protein
MYSRKRAARYLTAAFTAAIALSACASGGGSASGGAASGAGNGPVEIMGIFDLSNTNGIYTKWADSLHASVAGVNARGGIKGRKLQVVICDSAADANASAACGREAVSDNVIGVVSFTGTGNYDAYITPAHIADLNILTAPETYTSPNSFTIFGGGLAGSSGLAAIGKHYGCTKIAEMSTLTSPAQRSEQEAGFAKTAQSLGMQAAQEIFPVQGSPDMSTYAEDAVAEGVDCVALQAAGADEVSVVKALYQASKTIKVITAVPFTSGNEVALGSLMSRLYIQDVADEPSDTSVPAVRQWVADINKYSPSPKALDSNSAIIWAEGQLLAYAANHAASVTASGVESYLSHLSYYNPGVEPPINFTKPYATSLGTRIFSPTDRIVTWKNGQYVDSGPFYNVFTGEPWKATS